MNTDRQIHQYAITFAYHVLSGGRIAAVNETGS